MLKRLHRLARFIRALPPEREDWLLIEPPDGIRVPVPDFHRARHGLFQLRKGLLTRMEERRLLGPRLLIGCILFPIIVGPLCFGYAAVAFGADLPSFSGGQWAHLSLWQKLGACFVIKGHLNALLMMLMWYPAYVALFVGHIYWVQRRVRFAHYRIPRQNGLPNGLPHITPDLTDQYLALGDMCYIVDAPDRSQVRYRQGHKTLTLECEAPLGANRQVRICIPPGRPAWSDPSGDPIPEQQWPEILRRVGKAIKFAGYIPAFVTQ